MNVPPIETEAELVLLRAAWAMADIVLRQLSAVERMTLQHVARGRVHTNLASYVARLRYLRLVESGQPLRLSSEGHLVHGLIEAPHILEVLRAAESCGVSS